ncbi:MAG: pirin family protein [Rhodospirillales bacterium]
MMIRRPADERGPAEFGWLSSRHSFSFGEYHDPAQMGFRALRVINEDWIAPDSGFDTHGHRDMEIVTYVIEGTITHGDTLGNAGGIGPGEVQRMSAGTGIRHSEINRSPDEPVHLLQIWLLPERKGIAPGYEQSVFDRSAKLNRLAAIATNQDLPGALHIHQDATIYASILESDPSILESDRSLTHALAEGRHAWVQVVRGELSVNGTRLVAGDGLAVSDEARLDLLAGTGEESEFLLFDLA